MNTLLQQQVTHAPTRSSLRADLRLTEVAYSDYASVAALTASFGLKSDTYADWQHLWLDNPARKQYPESPMGWVLRTEDAVVGYLGSVPHLYEYGSRPLLSASGRAWVVTEQHRGSALLLVAKFLTQKNVDLFLNTSANSKSFRVLEAFGMTRVPAGHWDERTVWITQPAKMLARRLRGKGLPASGALGRLLAPPLALRSGLRNLRRAKFHAVEIERSGAFDGRFDDFWNELRARSPRLLAVRTREVLEWQFKAPLLSGRIWITTARRNSRLIGYAIAVRRDRQKLGTTRMLLVDVQTLPGEESAVVPMVEQIIAGCGREEIEVLESFGLSDEKRALLEQLAPFHRRLPSWMFFYSCRDGALARRLASPQVWDPSLFDGDAWNRVS